MFILPAIPQTRNADGTVERIPGILTLLRNERAERRAAKAAAKSTQIVETSALLCEAHEILAADEGRTFTTALVLPQTPAAER